MANLKTSSNTTVPWFKRSVNPITAVLAFLLTGGAGYVWMDRNSEQVEKWMAETPVLNQSVEGRTRSGIAVESWVLETNNNVYLCMMTKEAQIITCVREPKGSKA